MLFRSATAAAAGGVSTGGALVTAVGAATAVVVAVAAFALVVGDVGDAADGAAAFSLRAIAGSCGVPASVPGRAAGGAPLRGMASTAVAVDVAGAAPGVGAGGRRRDAASNLSAAAFVFRYPAVYTVSTAAEPRARRPFWREVESDTGIRCMPRAIRDNLIKRTTPPLRC